MHESSLRRMEWFVRTHLYEEKNYEILDVGSYDVNGSYKQFFKDTKFRYTGLDMEQGPNVDIVPTSTYNWDEISNDQYDAVISGQALEHIEYFWVTVKEMVRVTKEGGLICIIAPNGFGEHRYPVDCWRFFTDGMIALAKYNNLEILHAHTNSAPSISDAEWYSEDCADSMLIARKNYSGDAQVIELRGYRCVPSDLKKLRGNMHTFDEYLASKNGQNTYTKKEDENKASEMKEKNLAMAKSDGKLATITTSLMNRVIEKLRRTGKAK